MPCVRFKDKDGKFSGYICFSSRDIHPCQICGCLAEYRCDYPVKRYGRKEDCDLWLCSDCVKPGKSKNVHFCPHHYPLAVEAYERKQAALRETLLIKDAYDDTKSE